MLVDDGAQSDGECDDNNDKSDDESDQSDDESDESDDESDESDGESDESDAESDEGLPNALHVPKRTRSSHAREDSCLSTRVTRGRNRQ